MCGNHKQEKVLKYSDTEEARLAKDKEYAEMVQLAEESEGKKKGKKAAKQVKKSDQNLQKEFDDK